MLEDLAKIGIVIDHPGAISSQQMHYPEEGIPILLKWLPIIQNKSIQDCILLALCAPWAYPTAWKPLVKHFEEMNGIDKSLRWYVGNVLYSLAHKEVFEDILRLATDTKYGYDRCRIVSALAKMKDPRAVDALMDLLDDQCTYFPAIEALGKLKAVKARSKIEKFLTDHDEETRQLTKRALAKLDRQAEKISDTK